MWAHDAKPIKCFEKPTGKNINDRQAKHHNFDNNNNKNDTTIAHIVRKENGMKKKTGASWKFAEQHPNTDACHKLDGSHPTFMRWRRIQKNLSCHISFSMPYTF